MLNKDQMELSLAARARASAGQRQGSSRRAQWWFEQMRQATEQATEWKPIRRGGQACDPMMAGN